MRIATVPGLLALALAAAATACGSSEPGPDPAPAEGGAYVEESAGETGPLGTGKVERSEEEWRRILTPEQYRVLREKGTERAFSGAYWDTKTGGVYRCAGCDAVLFTSDAKFDSGCGWPSFFAPFDEGTVVETPDHSHGMVRTEITCARCGGHLGHVFEDGPEPTGLRYCINSVSIRLEEE